MTDINPTSFPADARDDLTGVIRYVLTKHLQNTDDMLPAKVIAFDRAKNRVSVQPLISVVTTSNTLVSRATIASLPVLQLGGGGFVLSFPIATGDLGWIKASDRDISLFLQSYTESQPNTARKHTFEDALFIPDTMMKGVTLADSSAVCIQSLDGTTSITMKNGVISINATTINLNGTTVAITAPTLTSNNVNISSTHVHSDPQGGVTGPPQ